MSENVDSKKCSIRCISFYNFSGTSTLLPSSAQAQAQAPAGLSKALFSSYALTRTSNKNAAKRSRQHSGKKYREYAKRRVCFVNEQVP